MLVEHRMPGPLESSSFRQRAPFGSQSNRFQQGGVDPRVACIRADMQTAHVAPGSYDITVRDRFGSKQMTKLQRTKSDWALQSKLDRGITRRKKSTDGDKSANATVDQLGPDSYRIPRWPQPKPVSSRSHYIIDTLASRFGSATAKWETPGPGSYGEHGIPHSAMEERARKSFSNKGLLDSGETANRSLPEVGCDIPPGCYERKGVIQETLDKVVGKRGPYDLFTPKRSDPPKTGHIQTEQSKLGPGEYKLPSDLEKLLSSNEKQHHGQFSQLDRMPKRPTDRLFTKMRTHYIVTDEPGPGAYDPLTVDKMTAGRHTSTNLPHIGFLVSARRNDKLATRFFTGNFNSVGPGRYEVTDLYDVNGHTNLFRSKTEARLSLEKAKCLKERLRERNVISSYA